MCSCQLTCDNNRKKSTEYSRFRPLGIAASIYSIDERLWRDFSLSFAPFELRNELLWCMSLWFVTEVGFRREFVNFVHRINCTFDFSHSKLFKISMKHLSTFLSWHFQYLASSLFSVILIYIWYVNNGSVMFCWIVHTEALDFETDLRFYRAYVDRLTSSYIKSMPLRLPACLLSTYLSVYTCLSVWVLTVIKQHWFTEIAKWLLES